MADAKRELADIITFQQLVMIIALVIILIGVANTISMATRDRVREIGVLRAIGFQKINIIILILVEGVVVSFLGGLLGTLIATFYMNFSSLQDAIMGVAVTLSVSVFVFTLAISFPLILGFIGGLPTAVVASRRSITDSLRNPG